MWPERGKEVRTEGNEGREIGQFGPHRVVGHYMGFISSALVSLVAFETEEVCDWVHDSKKPLCGIREKQGLSGTGVVVGAASGGDGGVCRA